jgi:hypothetical protein
MLVSQCESNLTTEMCDSHHSFSNLCESAPEYVKEHCHSSSVWQQTQPDSQGQAGSYLCGVTLTGLLNPKNNTVAAVYFHLLMKVYILLVQIVYSVTSLYIIVIYDFKNLPVNYNNAVYISTSFLSSIHSMYLLLKLLYDIETNPGPNISDNDDLSTIFSCPDSPIPDDLDFVYYEDNVHEITPAGHIYVDEGGLHYAAADPEMQWLTDYKVQVLEANLQAFSPFHHLLPIYLSRMCELYPPQSLSCKYYLLAYYNLLCYYMSPSSPSSLFRMEFSQTSDEIMYFYLAGNNLLVGFSLTDGFCLAMNETHFQDVSESQLFMHDVQLYLLIENFVDIVDDNGEPFEITDDLHFDNVDFKSIFCDYDPDLRDIMLMHDIEPNPGPVLQCDCEFCKADYKFLDVVALFFDALNFSGLSPDHDELEKRVMLLEMRFKLEKLTFKYLMCKNPGVHMLLDNITQVVSPMPQMFSSLNPLNYVSNPISPISDLADAIKHGSVSVDITPETLSSLTGIAQIASNVKVSVAPETIQALTPQIPDIFNLGNIFTWIQDPRNAACTFSMLIVVLMLLRRRYPSNSELLALCAAIGAISLLYLNSAVVASIVGDWVISRPVTNGGDDDWISISCEILSLGFFSRSISLTDSDSFGTTLAHAERKAKGFKDYLTRVKDLVTRIIKSLAETLGIEMNVGFDRHAQKIKTFVRRVMVLKQDPAMFDGNVRFEFARDVKQLEDDINAYLIKIECIRDNTSYLIAMKNVMSLMTPLSSVVKNSHLRRVVRRVPFNVNLVGESGVGKTQLANAAIPSLFSNQATADAILRAGSDFYSICFAPGLNDRYYDRYNRQFCWLFNDFLQRLEAIGAQQSDILLFIQMLGSSPLPLNCAEMTLKGLVMFASDLIFTSMNAYRITNDVVQVLTHMQALIRRLNEHMNVLVSVHPDYRVDNPVREPGVVYPYDDPKFFARLDKNKANRIVHPNGINTDVYVFDEWDSGTGQYKEGGFRGLNYDEWMALVEQRMAAHNAHQDRMNSQTALFMHNILDSRLAELQAAATMQSDPYEEEELIFPTLEYDLAPLFPNGPIEPSELTDSILADVAADIEEYESFDSKNTFSILTDKISDNTVCKWLKRYIENCQKDGIRYLIGPEYGCYISKDNYINKMLANASWPDLYHLAFEDLPDNVVYHSLRLRSRFQHILSATHVITMSYFHSVQTEFEKFKLEPLSWLKNNPYLAMLGIVTAGAGAALLYKGLSMAMDLSFKIFNFNPTEEPSLNSDETEIEIQGGERKVDHDVEFMRKPLANFSHVQIRARNDLISKYLVVSPSQCFGIAGHHLMMPYHVYDLAKLYFKRKGVSKVEFGFIPVNSRLTSPPQWFDFNDLSYDLSRSEDDMCFVKLPTSQNQFPDIRPYMPMLTPELLKYIKSRDFISASAWVYRAGLLTRERVKLTWNESLAYPVANKMFDPLTQLMVSSEIKNVVIKSGFKMDYPTKVGDCCMAVFIDDVSIRTLTSTDSCLQNPILCYLHLAGDPSVKLGYGSFFTCDDFSHIPGLKIRPVVQRIEEDMKMRSEVFSSVTGQCCPTEFVQPLGEYPSHLAPHHVAYAIMPKQPLSRHNDIARSELFYDVRREFGLTKMPVTLFQRPGKDDPMSVARDDYGSNIEFSINYKAAHIVAEEVVSELFSNSGPVLHTRVYTAKEVLEGVPDEGIRGNDRSTSWGYTMKVLAQAYGFTNSDLRWAFGKGDHYEYESSIAKVVLLLCARYDVSLQEGQDMAAIYMDCLKAECKDSEKARLFCACDKIFLLKTKQYFGGFANWIYVNRIRNGIAIGINPYTEWDIFYKWLTEVGQYGIFGDYKKYDKKQVEILMFVTKMAIDRYYSDCPEAENKARDVLFQEFVSSLHVALEKGDVAYLYSWFHGNTSGNLLTAIINSITGLFIVKYAACDVLLLPIGGIEYGNAKNLAPLLRDLRKGTRVIVYGDDNGIMIHESLRDRLDFYTLGAAIHRNFGMEYTDEQKGKRIGYVVPKHTHIFEATFIARGFRLEGDLIVGPLRFVSILESLAWYKKTRDPLELLRRVERSLKELSAWGREQFYKLQPFLVKICRKHLDREPAFQLWEAAFAAFQIEESLYFDPSFIYGPLNLDGLLLSPDNDESD